MNVFSVTDDNGDELAFDFETHMLNQDEDSIATMTSEQRARRLRNACPGQASCLRAIYRSSSAS